MTAPTVPTTPAELEELVSDKDRVMQMIEAGQFADLVENYTRTVMNKDGDIERQIDEGVQRGIVKFLKDNGTDVIGRVNLSPGQATRSAQRNAQYNAKAPGAALDNKFEDLVDFFASTWHAQKDPGMVARIAEIRNNFSGTIPSDGGFLVPEVLRSQLMMVALEKAVVRPRAMVVPMVEGPKISFPSIDSTSNESDVFGGIEAFWTEEGAEIPDSDAEFGTVTLEAKDLTAYTEVNNNLIHDSVGAFAAFIEAKFPEAIAHFEDRAHFDGSGVGQPEGFLRADAAVAIEMEDGQPVSTIVWENIAKMYARMLPTSLGTAVWIASSECFPELATMALSVGTGGAPIWINNGVQGPPLTILGRPVIFSEKSKRLGQAGDLNFVDLGYYLVGDRQRMETMSSPHYKFRNNKTAYRFIQRGDGRPWLQSAITPANGGDPLTPFVKIEARA